MFPGFINKIASLASDWFILFSKCWTEFGGLKYTNLISSVHSEIKCNVLSRVNLLKASTQLFTVKSLIFFFYFQMKTTKYTSIYISMFNESIVPLLYNVYLINPLFKLKLFYCFFGVFFRGGGGVTLFRFPKTEGACVSLCFSVKSEWNIWDIEIAHESDYLEFLHKIMEVIRYQKPRHAVM